MKANRHFTLLLAWRRYVDTKDTGKKYGYSQFCALFTGYLRTHDLVEVLRHEPGRAMLVDWAGDTMDVVDTITGEVVRAVLFVAVLPFSGLMFCRAYADMKSPAWLDAHVQAGQVQMRGVTRLDLTQIRCPPLGLKPLPE